MTARCGPLHAIQERQGATFRGWQGCLWADGFGDPVGEHRAVRTDAGIWDISPLRKWEFRGPDALAAVDRLFTNDVAGAETGRIRYGLFCDERGAIVNDGTVYRLAYDHLWVFTSRASDREHFERHLAGADVRLESIADAMAAVQLQGPRSRSLLRELAPGLPSLGYFHFHPAPVDVAGVPCWISRLGYTGELGYELFCAPERAESLWRSLLAAGARPYGFAAVETLRIEAGLLLLDADFVSGRTSPFDVSLDPFVRLDKPDFVGRAALTEIAALPPCQLVAVVLDADELPQPGAAVARAGERVGTLTSVCRSPTLGRVIGLARAARRSSGAGERVSVVMPSGAEAPADLRRVPLYDPDKRRPRKGG
jgi:aminomethyltransferase